MATQHPRSFHKAPEQLRLTDVLGSVEEMERIQQGVLDDWQAARRIRATYYEANLDIGMVWAAQQELPPSTPTPTADAADTTLQAIHKAMSAVKTVRIAIAHMDIGHAFNSASMLIRKGWFDDPRLPALNMQVMRAHVISQQEYSAPVLCEQAREIAYNPPSVDRQKAVWQLLWWGVDPVVVEYAKNHGLIEINKWGNPVQPGEQFLWPAAALP